MPPTDADTSNPRFPLARSCALLTAAALGVTVVIATLLASIPGWSAAAPAVAFAAAMTWFAALISLLPVAALGRYGVSATINAYFAGMAGRLLLCSLAAVVGIFALHLSTQPLLLGMAGMYLPLLLAEAAIVGRYLSRKDAGLSPPGAQHQPKQGGDGLNWFTPVLASEDLMDHVLPHKVLERPLFVYGDYKFYLTNHLLMTLVAAVLMLVIFPLVARRVKSRGASAEDFVTKGRFAQFFESICEYIRTEVTQPALGHLTDKYIKFIWNVFFFVLFCNLLGMIPIGPILRLATGNHHTEEWGGTATGNISVTAGLAVVSLFMIHAVGIREHGIKYFAHFNPGPWYMAPLLVPLEIIGAGVKPFALCVRLFANMVAGHLVLAALLGLIFTFKNYGVAAGSVLGATALSLLELFVCFLQAYIFTFLTVLFIAAGAVHEHEHGEHENHDDTQEYGHHEPPLEHAVVREPPHSKTLP